MPLSFNLKRKHPLYKKSSKLSFIFTDSFVMSFNFSALIQFYTSLASHIYPLDKRFTFEKAIFQK